jgi:hypothetical protein
MVFWLDEHYVDHYNIALFLLYVDRVHCTKSFG